MVVERKKIAERNHSRAECQAHPVHMLLNTWYRKGDFEISSSYKLRLWLQPQVTNLQLSVSQAAGGHRETVDDNTQWLAASSASNQTVNSQFLSERNLMNSYNNKVETQVGKCSTFSEGGGG